MDHTIIGQFASGRTNAVNSSGSAPKDPSLFLDLSRELNIAHNHLTQLEEKLGCVLGPPERADPPSRTGSNPAPVPSGFFSPLSSEVERLHELSTRIAKLTLRLEI